MGIAINVLAGFLAALIGYVVGMSHAEAICTRQYQDLMETHDSPQGKTPSSDMILRNRAAECWGCAWHIGLWIRPWKWGRPKVSMNQAK